jgi:uncharacterized protein
MLNKTPPARVAGGALRLHPDWRLLGDGSLFNRFTLERLTPDPGERVFLEAIAAGGDARDPATEAALVAAGIVTTEDAPSSALETFSSRAQETSDIKISQARFVLTEVCNMGCPGCFVRFKYRDDMEFGSSNGEIARRVVDFLVRQNPHGVARIHFFGGEPLVRMDLIEETIRYARGRADETTFTFSLTTNGTLVDEDIAKYLDEHDVTVGVSFDGGRETNDKVRMFMDGRGSFDAALRGYRTLQKHLKKGVGILVTPQPANIGNLSNIVEHLLDELKPDALTVNHPFHSLGRWEVDPQEFIEHLKIIILLCEERRIPLISPATQIIRAIARQEPKLQTLVTSNRQFTVGISVDGRISYHIMNFDKLIFEDRLTLTPGPGFRTWAKFSGYQHPECRDCVAIHTCGGPDPIESYAASGHVDSIQLNPDRCRFYQEMTPWLAEKM